MILFRRSRLIKEKITFTTPKRENLNFHRHNELNFDTMLFCASILSYSYQNEELLVELDDGNTKKKLQMKMLCLNTRIQHLEGYLDTKTQVMIYAARSHNTRYRGEVLGIYKCNSNGKDFYKFKEYFDRLNASIHYNHVSEVKMN